MKTPFPKSIGNPATSALAHISIHSLEELTRLTEKELANLHGVGPKAISILKPLLASHNLHLKPPTAQPKSK